MKPEPKRDLVRKSVVAGLLLSVAALAARADSLTVRGPWTNQPVEIPGSAALPPGEYVLTYVAGAVSHDPRRGYEVTEAYASSGVRAGYHLLDSLEPESLSLDLWLSSQGLQSGASVAEVEERNRGRAWHFQHRGGRLWITHLDDYDGDNSGPGVVFRVDEVRPYVDAHTPGSTGSGAGFPDGTVVRAPDGPVFVMHNGARRVIPDRETFTSMRLSVETIQIVPEWGLAWIPLGPPIPRGSTSLSPQTPAPPQGGSARPQITPAPPGTASALPPARTVPDDQVASAPLGSPVQAIAQPAPTTTRAPPKPTPAAAPSPAPQATAAARVARQPEGAPLEGELYTGPQPLCGDFLRHTGPQINGKCVPNNVVSCQGYRNVFTGGFVNIDWQMSVLDNKHVIGIRIRADNGRHNLIRVCLGATATGRMGFEGRSGTLDRPVVIDADPRSESTMDGVVNVHLRNRNSTADIQLTLDFLQIYEHQPRGWVRLR